MAQKGAQLDSETFSCSICLDLLKDPVTIPCGHSYCMSCIKGCWDAEEKKTNSCPQCRRSFIPRPVLEKSTMLAALLEQLKQAGLDPAASAADHCYAGPEDVACDFCSGRKLKAFKSCLVCLVSYCQKHLQPHFQSPAFQKHKLVEPSEKLQENICSHHHEMMKIFCRTDQQCICYLCAMDEHKGHHTVSAAAERNERQKELEENRRRIQRKIRDREKDVEKLQQEVKNINDTADEAAEDSERSFTLMIVTMEKRRSYAEQRIRSLQESEVSRVKELQVKLEQELIELKMKDAELKQLSLTDHHTQFLQRFPSLSHLREPGDSPSIKIRPQRYLEDVKAVVSATRDKLQDILIETESKLSQMTTPVEVLPTKPEPRTRDPFISSSIKKHLTILLGHRGADVYPSCHQARGRVHPGQVAGSRTRDEFLKYSCEITLDPNTAHTQLLLSEGNRKATFMREDLSYFSHRDRFKGWWYQVLSRKSLTGHCYWEVELTGKASVAVAYKNISRAGGESAFGLNNKSWALECDNQTYTFIHNKVSSAVSGPGSSRVGVYLDHSAGLLSFYSVSKTMTLLHRVQTTFTQPLHAGLRFWLGYGATAELIELN
ncbi:tripartite motif-containing protein 16-like [Aulostomus maculatus]